MVRVRDGPVGLLRKVFFGTAWFFLIYFGTCAAIGAFLGAAAGARDPQHASEAAGIAAQQFIHDHVLHIFAGSFLLAVVGALTGFLPGTRRRIAPTVAGVEGQITELPAPSPGPFGIREGIVALVWVIAAQLLVYITVGIFAAFDVGMHATAEVRTARVFELMPIGLLLAYAVAAIVLFQIYRGYARRLDWPAIKDSFGLAWGTAAANSVGLLSGVVLAMSFLFLAPQVADPAFTGPSTTSTMVGTSAGLIAFTMVLVLLAPPTEELLFRSLLIRSFASRLSLPVAAFVAAALFWVIHVPETQNYWPAEIVIAMLAALVTYLRISNRALGPAISSHAGYNLVIAGSLLLSSGGG
jgi:membrane protease YdiL (CAAX protease family)